MAQQMNAREQLEAAAFWLGMQNEDLSFGLRSAEDGIKLWRYMREHEEMPEMADMWSPSQLRKALGYNPFMETAA